MLAGLSPFVEQVFRLTGLLEQFRRFETLENALNAATTSITSRNEIRIGSRIYQTKWIADANSTLEYWGTPDKKTEAPFALEDFVDVTFEDLAFSLGIGGLGNFRAELQIRQAFLFQENHLPG